jgi:hypothetical protein
MPSARIGNHDRRIIGHMTYRDPAFLWETEAMRSSPQRVAEAEHDASTDAVRSGRWVTLREANRATGIPVETLRKWARRSTVPTYLSPTPGGGPNIRMVDLDGVERRAAELGREIGGGSAVEPPTTAEERTPNDHMPGESNPPGTMIVPIDAWNKMLNQLGNLHEAGQQLAAARERAAKAETEAAFLRERLAELRQTQEGTAAAVPSERALSTPPSPTATRPPEKVWHYLVRRIRDR